MAAAVPGCFTRLLKLFSTAGAPATRSMLDYEIRCHERLVNIQQAVCRGAKRYDLFNAIIAARGYRRYLEIGVRNPQDCFDKIRVLDKVSVDPGLEYAANPVTHALTSDDFFAAVRSGALHHDNPHWDVIFIDGLHRADQVWRDICNSLACLSEGGVIFVHDCFPPVEEFAREQFAWSSASGWAWCGTAWKAFARYLREGEYLVYVLDAEVGIGVIDTRSRRTVDLAPNEFYEYDRFVEGVRSGGLLRQPADALASWKS